MNQEVKKNQPATVALIVNFAMLMSTVMLLGITFLIPAGGAEQAAVATQEMSSSGLISSGSISSAPTLFYIGLGLALLGLAVGHTSRGGGRVALQKHIMALALIEACALFGLMLHMTQGDVERGRSMMILGIVGVGSLFLNIKNFRTGPESN